MKKLLLMLLVSALLIPSLAKRLAAEDDNPTGVSGVYNGNVTTAGNYDPHTGNAMRVVEDLVVPGGVGAYPLKWSRYFNSRSLPCSWTFSYNGYGLVMGGTMSFPDGRVIKYLGLESPPDPTGIEEQMGTWNGYNTIFLPDGGKVVCAIVSGSSSYPTQLIDPYGQITTLTRDAYFKLTRVTEPGGRYLQITWQNPNTGSFNNYITSVKAFDGIAGHNTPIETVTYSWGPFTLGGGQSTTVLNSVTYSDGTSAAYTYLSVPTSNGAGATRKAVLLTCDDVRYPGPMHQIAYSTGMKGKIDNEKNKVTSEVLSTITGLTGPTGGANTTETRGDGATRSFTYPPYNPTDPNASPDPATFGKMLTYTDFAAHTTTLDYELFLDSPSCGFIKKVTDVNGHSTSYTRQTGSWGIKRITHDVDGSHIDQTFWPNNSETSPYYLASRTDELGHTTTYTRDTNNRITRKDYPDGGYEEFTYNNFGEVLTHTRAQSLSPLVIESESFVYDTRGLKTSWTDAAGGVTTYTYYTSSDFSGLWTDRLKTVTKPVNISGFQQTETYEYDKTIVSGVDTGAACSGRGIVTKISHTDGSTILYAHNKWGDILTTTDELSHVTTNTYDEYGRVLTTASPARFTGDTMSHTTTFSYVPWGYASSKITTSKLPFVVTLPSAKKTNTYYDANWRKTRVQQAPGTADEANSYLFYDSYAGYTSIGNLLAAQDPRGYVTKYHYDIRDRQDQITDPLGTSLGDPNHTTTFTFDAHSNKLTELHPKPDASATTGELIEFDGYDAMNRLTHKKVHRDATTIDQTSMSYDKAGNLASNTDENGYVYSYQYDTMNRRTSMIYPDTNKHEDTAYDFAGNVKTYRNRNGNIQTFTCDNRNRATNFTWEDGVTSSQSTVYDTASRVTQIANAISTINHVYYNDNLLNTQEEWTTQFGDNVHRTLTYTYDADGNRANVQYPSGTAFNYNYTNRNQASAIKPGLSGGTAIVSYTYDTSGNITAAARDNSTSTAVTVDAVNRQTAVVHTMVATTKRFDYAYNNVDDITVVQRDSGLGDGYKYDLTQQITEYQQNGTVNLSTGTVTSPATDNNMTFDGCGNRTVLNGTNQSFNNMNQPTGGTFNHDAEGNLSAYNGWVYTYDAQNRLIGATNGATAASFYYDGKNRQVARSINGAITFSVWDDWELIEEYGTGNIVTARYLQGAHGPIKSLISNNYFYQDSLGSTSHIANATGTLLEYYKYDLNGKPTYWNTLNNQLSTSSYGIVDLFAGERYIPEISLYDDRNRFMSPDLGRFLQPDSTGFNGDPSNLYRYCGNDWANRSDAKGLSGTLVINVNPNQDVRGGHAWNTFFSDQTHQATRMGTWRNQGVYSSSLDSSELEGIRDYGNYGKVSRSAWIDDAGEARMNAFLNAERQMGKAAYKEVKKNCTSFATGMWQAGTGEQLAYIEDLKLFKMGTTRQLAKSIQQANGGKDSGYYNTLASKNLTMGWMTAGIRSGGKLPGVSAAGGLFSWGTGASGPLFAHTPAGQTLHALFLQTQNDKARALGESAGQCEPVIYNYASERPPFYSRDALYR